MWSCQESKTAIYKAIRTPTPHNQKHHISHKMLSSTSYDGQGFWLLQKRLSKAWFQWWPEASGNSPGKPLEAYEAQLLLAASDVSGVRAAPMWRGAAGRSLCKSARSAPAQSNEKRGSN